MLEKTIGLFTASLALSVAQADVFDELLPSVPLEELKMTREVISDKTRKTEEYVFHRKVDGRYCAHIVIQEFYTYEEGSWDEYRSISFFNDSCDAELDHLYVNHQHTSTLSELHELLEDVQASSSENKLDYQDTIVDQIIAREAFNEKYRRLYERESYRSKIE